MPKSGLAHNLPANLWSSPRTNPLTPVGAMDERGPHHIVKVDPETGDASADETSVVGSACRRGSDCTQQ